jgi:hypothetical protein
VRGNILLVGANERLQRSLEGELDGVSVRTACCVADTEGREIDTVVIANDHPFEELTQVRVHPYLYDMPVVLLAPGHRVAIVEWKRSRVWPVTSTGIDQLDDLVRAIGEVLARAHHPSARAQVSETAA